MTTCNEYLPPGDSPYTLTREWLEGFWRAAYEAGERSCQNVISDLQQDSTAFIRGLAEGHARGMDQAATVVEGAHTESLEGSRTRDRLAERIRMVASGGTRYYVHPGAVRLKAGTFEADLDARCQGSIRLDGMSVGSLCRKLWARLDPGTPPEVEITVAAVPRAIPGVVDLTDMVISSGLQEHPV